VCCIYTFGIFFSFAKIRGIHTTNSNSTLQTKKSQFSAAFDDGTASHGCVAGGSQKDRSQSIVLGLADWLIKVDLADNTGLFFSKSQRRFFGP